MGELAAHCHYDDYYSISNSSSNFTYNHSKHSVGPTSLPPIMVFIAFVAAAIATVIALFNVYKHLVNYTRPEFQKSLIRIIIIVPIYSTSALSLAFPEYAFLIESVRDIWEAVVIYEFLRLILAYCGGESATILVIMKKPGSISHLWPMNYCLPRLRLDARFMRICKRLTLQFVFVKPIMAIINVILYYECLINDPYYSMSQLIIYNVSYTLSLYGLLLFYFATHHHPRLVSRQPIVKFLAVKLVIFATYYQGLAVKLIPGYSTKFLESLNNFIFCIEMIFFALFHVWAFGWFEFVGGGEGIDVDNPLALPPGSQSIAIGGDDYEITKTVPQEKKVQENVKDALNMEDVVKDALENFNTKYDTHVRLDTHAHNNDGSFDYEEDEEDPSAKNPFENLSQSNTYSTNHNSYSIGQSAVPPPPHGRRVDPYPLYPEQQQQNPPQTNPFQDNNPFQTDIDRI